MGYILEICGIRGKGGNNEQEELIGEQHGGIRQRERKTMETEKWRKKRGRVNLRKESELTGKENSNTH